MFVSMSVLYLGTAENIHMQVCPNVPSATRIGIGTASLRQNDWSVSANLYIFPLDPDLQDYLGKQTWLS